MSNSFFEAYNDYAGNLTDAPKIYHEIVALNLLSLAVGDSEIKITPEYMYPNLWTIIIGLSGIERKSSSLSLGQSILPTGSHRLPNEFTKEAFIEELSNNPQGISIWDECGSLLEQIKNSKHYLASLDDILCLLYGLKGSYKRKLRSGEFNLDNVCFNLLWATTYSKFKKYISADVITSGFLARFLIVYGHKDFYMPRRNLTTADTERQNKARELLQQIWNVFHSEPKKSFEFESHALELINAWQLKHEEKASQMADLEEADVYGAIITRLGDYLIKFSALYEVERNLSEGKLINLSSPLITINIGSVEKSTVFIDKMISWISDNLIRLLSSSYLIANLTKLNNIMLNLSPKNEFILHSEILPRMHIKTKELKELYQTALESEYIETKKVGKALFIKRLKKFPI